MSNNFESSNTTPSRQSEQLQTTLLEKIAFKLPSIGMMFFIKCTQSCLGHVTQTTRRQTENEEKLRRTVFT